MQQSPFAETTSGGTSPTDEELVQQVKGGSHEALELLIRRHQPWVYNIVLRMIYHPQDAEDVTQEILIKLLTKLSTFEGRSRFRTWLYRIVTKDVLNMKRARAEDGGRRSPVGWTFSAYGRGLNGAADMELPEAGSVPVDTQLLVDEARIGCSSGMLLCLDREQRLVYVLGDILGVTSTIGAELLDITPDNFRQKLARARRDLHSFMQDKCGLVNKANPRRCAKKTRAFMEAGYVDPQNLLFARAHVTRVRDVAARTHQDLAALDAAYAEIHRDHPATFQSILGRPDE